METNGIDPDYEDLQAGRLTPEDIRASQTRATEQAAADARSTGSGSSTAPAALPGKDAPTQPEPETSASDAVRLDGPRPGDTAQSYDAALGEGIARGILPTQLPQNEAPGGPQRRERATEGYQRQLDAQGRQRAEQERAHEVQQREEAGRSRNEAQAASLASNRAAMTNFKAVGGVTHAESVGGHTFEAPDMQPNPSYDARPGAQGPGITGAPVGVSQLPVFKKGIVPDEEPVNQDGQDFAKYRDEYGHVSLVPVEEAKGFYGENKQTGERWYNVGNRRVQLTPNANTEERNKLIGQNEEMIRGEQQAKLNLDEARHSAQMTNQALSDYYARQIGGQSKDEQIKGALNKLKANQPTLDNPKATKGAKALAAKQIADAKLVLADPEFTELDHQNDLAKADVEAKQAAFDQRRQQALDVARDLDKVKAARLLPPGMDSRQLMLDGVPAGSVRRGADGSVSVDPAVVEVLAGQKASVPMVPFSKGQRPSETPNVSAYREALEGLGNQGVTKVGDQPIDDAIKKAKELEQKRGFWDAAQFDRARGKAGRAAWADPANGPVVDQLSRLDGEEAALNAKAAQLPSGARTRDEQKQMGEIGAQRDALRSYLNGDPKPWRDWVAAHPSDTPSQARAMEEALDQHPGFFASRFHYAGNVDDYGARLRDGSIEAGRVAADPNAGAWAKMKAIASGAVSTVGELGNLAQGRQTPDLEAIARARQAYQAIGELRGKDAEKALDLAQGYYEKGKQGQAIAPPDGPMTEQELMDRVGKSGLTLGQAQQVLDELRKGGLTPTLRNFVASAAGAASFQDAHPILIDAHNPEQVAQKNALTSLLNEEIAKHYSGSTVAGSLVGSLASWELGSMSALAATKKLATLGALGETLKTATDAVGTERKLEAIARGANYVAQSAGGSFREDPRAMGAMDRLFDIGTHTATLAAGMELGGAVANRLQAMTAANAQLPFMARWLAHSAASGVAMVGGNAIAESMEGRSPLEDQGVGLNMAAALFMGLRGSLGERSVQKLRQARDTQIGVLTAYARANGLEPSALEQRLNAQIGSAKPFSPEADRAKAELLGHLAGVWADHAGSPETYAQRHDDVQALRGALDDARKRGDDGAVQQFKDQLEQAQSRLDESGARLLRMAPEHADKVAGLVGYPGGGQALQGALRENPALRAAAVEIGHHMAGLYLDGARGQAAGLLAEGSPARRAAIEQLVGAHAVNRDLAALLRNDKIDESKAQAFEQLGLARREDNGDDTNTYRVTADGLALLPRATRDAVAAEPADSTKFTVATSHGNPGAIANNLARAGEDRVRAAADGQKANAGARQQTAKHEAKVGAALEAQAAANGHGVYEVKVQIDSAAEGGTRTVPVRVAAANEAEAAGMAVEQARRQGGVAKDAKVVPVGVRLVKGADEHPTSNAPTRPASPEGKQSAQKFTVTLSVTRADGKTEKVPVAVEAANKSEANKRAVEQARKVWPDAQIGVAGVEAAGEKAAPVTAQEAGGVFGKVYGKWKKDLAELGITKLREAKDSEGLKAAKAPKRKMKAGDEETAPLAVRGDTLMFHRGELAEIINARLPGVTPEEAVEAHLVHEVIHGAALQVISEGEAEHIARTAPAALVKVARAGYRGWDELTPWQQGHELVRTVVEGRYRGRITEQIYHALEALLEHLGIRMRDLPENELLRRAADRTKAVLDAHGIDISASRVDGGSEMGDEGRLGAARAPEEELPPEELLRRVRADEDQTFDDGSGTRRPSLEAAEEVVRRGDREGQRAAQAAGFAAGGPQDQGARRQAQGRALLDWAAAHGLVARRLPEEWENNTVPNVGGKEHDVWHDESSGRWTKIARDPRTPVLYPGEVIDGEKATPLEYFANLRGLRALFGVQSRFHGVHLAGDEPRPIISQADVHGEHASVADIDRILRSEGFAPVDEDSKGWYRPADNTALWDPHPGNLRKLRDASGRERLTGYDGFVRQPESAMREVLQRMYDRWVEYNPDEAAALGRGEELRSARSPEADEDRARVIHGLIRSGQNPEQVARDQRLSVEQVERAYDAGLKASMAHFGNGGVTRGPEGIWLRAATAYHGTPHEVDRFSTEHIGEGEGSQVYGWGLYLAEHPQVAESYRDAGIDPAKSPERKAHVIEALHGSDEAKKVALTALHHAQKIYDDARLDPEFKMMGGVRETAREIEDRKSTVDHWAKVIRILDTPPLRRSPIGNVYTVRLNVEDDEVLDFDKPLKEQSPKVRAAVESLLGPQPDEFGEVPVWMREDAGRDRWQTSGASVYTELAKRNGRVGEGDWTSPPIADDQAASEALRGAGIVAMRYLDQGSRAPATIYNVGSPAADFGPYTPFTSRADAEKHLEMVKRYHPDAEITEQKQSQTSNYVVFDDSRIEITHRNGEPVDREQVLGSSKAPVSAALRRGEPVVHPELFHESNVDRAAAEAHPGPTEAQKEAGNYRKGHTRISGLDISIENPAGSTRSGTDRDGKPWSVEMGAHYGYIRGTEGRDGDHVDVMIKPGTPEDWRGPVYVVNQVDPRTGKFDEHKGILGAESFADAERIYRGNFAAGWDGLGSLEAMPFEAFKQWASDPAQTARRADTTAEASKSVAELVKDNMGLAVTIANSYRNIPGLEFDDVLGEARKALVKAAQGFDPAHESGAPFGAYAGSAVRNSLNRLFTNQRRHVEMEGRSAEEPRKDEGGRMKDEGENSLKNSLVDGGAQSAVSRGMEDRETKAALDEAMGRLPERVRQVLTLSGEGKSLREIGEAIGLSHTMAGRILENGRKAVETWLRAKGFKGVDADGVLYAAKAPLEHEPSSAESYAETERQIAEEANRTLLAMGENDGRKAEEYVPGVVRDFLIGTFAGKVDAIDRVVPGVRALLLDTHVTNARIAGALRVFQQRMMEAVKKSFGNPSRWREKANLARLKGFIAELLPTAARLNAVAQDAHGEFTFQDFWMRAGHLPGAQEKEMGVNGVMVTLAPGVFVAGRKLEDGTREKLRVKELVETEGKGKKRSIWQLERFMPAAEQWQLHRDFHEKYPEAAHWLDSWINPNLADSRVEIGGISLADFNRFSLQRFWGDISPFGPMAELPGYTPDIAVTKSLVGAVRQGMKDLLNRTWTSPGREYKSGEARERGQVGDLFAGFNQRAMEVHLETQRRALAEGLLSKALKQIPDTGELPFNYVKWSDEVIDQLLRAHHAARGLDPGQYKRFEGVAKSGQLGTMEADIARISNLAGRIAAEAARTGNMMIHKRALQELRQPIASQAVNMSLLQYLGRLREALGAEGGLRAKVRAVKGTGEALADTAVGVARTAMRGWATGVLANPFTAAMYQWSEELFIAMHTLRKGLEGLYSLPFSLKAIGGDRAAENWKQAKFGLYEAGQLAKGMITDRWYNKNVRELVPKEMFGSQHRWTTVAPDTFEQTPWDLLRTGNVAGLVLKGLRFHNIDLRAKQRVAFASYLAHGRLAWDDGPGRTKGVDPATGQRINKGEWIKNWLQHDAPPEVHRQAYETAVLVAHDYANVPPLLDDSRQWMVGGHDITPLVNTLRTGVAPFAKYPYNLFRQGKRWTWDSFGDLLGPNRTGGQRRAALANLTMMTLMYLLARHYMDDDAEGTPQLGREMDDNGNRLDGAFNTAGRLNITHTHMGRVMTAALDMFGMHDVADEDKWLRIRNIPYASSAAALATLWKWGKMKAEGREDEHAELEGNVHAVFADMVSEGVLLKMVNEIRGEEGPYDKGKNVSYALMENAFDLATARFLPPPLLRTAKVLIDPVQHRTRPNAALGYDPGPVEALENKIPWLGKGLPTSGVARPRREGSAKAEEEIAQTIAREYPEANIRHYLDRKSGRATVVVVSPGKVQVRPRVLELFRALGWNVKFIPHDEYVKALSALPD